MRLPAPHSGYTNTEPQVLHGRRKGMLWLILGIILLVIAIAGGAIVHPVIFVLGVLALLMAVTGWRGRAA